MFGRITALQTLVREQGYKISTLEHQHATATARIDALVAAHNELFEVVRKDMGLVHLAHPYSSLSIFAGLSALTSPARFEKTTTEELTHGPDFVG